jgi:hypothetical protein
MIQKSVGFIGWTDPCLWSHQLAARQKTSSFSPFDAQRLEGLAERRMVNETSYWPSLLMSEALPTPIHLTAFTLVVLS